MHGSTIEADPKQRVRLDVSYDGSGFSGWAIQPQQRTVQETLESALATILRLPTLRVHVAGRTDTGVHALGQVTHVDLPVDVWTRERGQLLHRLAGVLPLDVRVRAVRAVPAAFDARFSALWRRYEYLITDAPWGVEPLRRGVVLGWPRPLDEVAMAEVAGSLLGLNNFAAFCRRREGATTIRSLQQFTVVRSGHDIVCTLVADAFCHSMVRSLIGALLAVGEGRQPLDWPASLLRCDRRSDQVRVAPARGLTLVEVGYPPDDELAARAAVSRARRD